ncbi:hypothetical protein V476_02875 [Pseudomonas syringae KCTC 12500]|uniref:hypothetical protein n=1 Tax=Pseudomonas syringae TaxID=317 RepID=UPI000468E898|nr:hypothetical protein [Pseudomonas syringae]KMY00146.1 hypothetical protein V476_02875 [Pseudomonas syringae KCTC 12500]POR83144.1 hypothetical protein BKM21_24290 [Pseudomonas syringae pv. syringae]
MSEINLPPEQQECIKAVGIDSLYKLVDQSLYNEDPSALRELHLEACGDYVATQLRAFERALSGHAKAKSVKKRANTEMDVRRAGGALISSVQQMQQRVEREEKEGLFFFIDDYVMQPFGSSSNLSMSISYRWRVEISDPWIYGGVKFIHQYSTTSSDLSYPPKRKQSLASEARKREMELYSEWDHLRRLALHSVKDFFKQGGSGYDIPAQFNAKLSTYGGGLNNHSLRFWD